VIGLIFVGVVKTGIGRHVQAPDANNLCSGKNKTVRCRSEDAED
jgi:hypothetical protein